MFKPFAIIFNLQNQQALTFSVFHPFVPLHIQGKLKYISGSFFLVIGHIHFYMLALRWSLLKCDVVHRSLNNNTCSQPSTIAKLSWGKEELFSESNGERPKSLRLKEEENCFCTIIQFCIQGSPATSTWEEQFGIKISYVPIICKTCPE